MSAGYDGSIKIDTSIDSKGFNSGMQRMIGSAKSLAGTLGLALGIGSIIAFGKASVDAASEMSNAFIGLQSVVEGQGKSFAQAKKFLQEYISDGLVPLTNAAGAYKNLAARGYSTDQIEQVLAALKDSASFGRQGSLSMGQAIQGATEGLKNENSILVDNAGVTKNVSMMWKDYAQSIGTTVGALTKEQKIQAEVNGIMEETRFQTGDAVKLAGTYSGQISALGVSMTNLKAAIGNALIPILSQLLPYIKAAIDALTIFFNQVGQVVNALFGTNLSITDAATQTATELADSTDTAAESQGNLAEQTEAATKAAKGALAAFDELNVLQQDTGSTGGGTAAGTTDTTGLLPAVDATPIAEGLTDLQNKFLEFKEKIMVYLQPVIDLWHTLGEVWGSVKRALQPVWDWLWEHVLVPLGNWAGDAFIKFLGWMTERLKDFSKWIDENQTLFLILLGFFAFLALVLLIVLSPAAQFIAILLVIGAVLAATAVIGFLIGYNLRQAWDSIVEKWQDAAAWFQDTVVEPLKVKFNELWNTISEWAAKAWEWVKEKWSDASDWFREKFIDPVTSFFGKFWSLLEILANNAWAVIKYVWGLAAEWFGTNVIAPLSEKFSGIWDNIERFAADARQRVAEVWSDASGWFSENITNPLAELFESAWTRIGDNASDAWKGIKETFSSISSWASDNIKDPIKGAFGSALDWVQDKFNDVFDSIGEFVKGVINGIISLLNGMLSGIVGGFNDLIKGANLMGSVVPGWVNIPTLSAMEIPYLATGAVIPPNSQFLAVLGDQKSGRNIEAPEGLIRQIVSEEMGKIEASVTINFAGSFAQMVQEMKPYIDKENVRVGGSLIKSGATTS